MHAWNYDETKPLHFETDASGVGLRAGLLQKRNSTSCPRDMAPDNNIHRPIIFASKSIQCREEIQQYRKRSIRYITWPRKIPSLLLCKRGEYNYRLQANSGNIQERHGNIIAKTTVNTLQNTPIESQNYIQSWSRLLHCGLVIQTKHEEDKDEEIAGMQMNVNTVEMAKTIIECVMICELQHETGLDNHLQQVKNASLKDCQRTKTI